MAIQDHYCDDDDSYSSEHAVYAFNTLEAAEEWKHQAKSRIRDRDYYYRETRDSLLKKEVDKAREASNGYITNVQQLSAKIYRECVTAAEKARDERFPLKDLGLVENDESVDITEVELKD